MLSYTEMEALAADISANGLRQPIVTWRGMIVDGRNRLAACEIAGVEPAYAEMEFTGDRDVVAYVISTNMTRRHLTVSQRAHAAALLATLRQGRPPAIQPRPANLPVSIEGDLPRDVRQPRPASLPVSVDGDPAASAVEPRPADLPVSPEGELRADLLGLMGIEERLPKDKGQSEPANLPVYEEPLLDVPTQAEAAALLQVSERSVRQGRVVVSQGTPELNRAVAAGDIPVSTAADVAQLPAERQDEILSLPKKDRRAAIEAAEVDAALDAVAGADPAEPSWWPLVAKTVGAPAEQLQRLLRKAHSAALDLETALHALAAAGGQALSPTQLGNLEEVVEQTGRLADLVESSLVPAGPTPDGTGWLTAAELEANAGPRVRASAGAPAPARVSLPGSPSSSSKERESRRAPAPARAPVRAPAITRSNPGANPEPDPDLFEDLDEEHQARFGKLLDTWSGILHPPKPGSRSSSVPLPSTQVRMLLELVREFGFTEVEWATTAPSTEGGLGDQPRARISYIRDRIEARRAGGSGSTGKPGGLGAGGYTGKPGRRPEPTIDAKWAARNKRYEEMVAAGIALPVEEWDGIDPFALKPETDAPGARTEQDDTGEVDQ